MTDLVESPLGCLTFFAVYGLLVVWAREIAKKKGLDPTPYFALAIFLTPLVGILAAFLSRPNRAVAERQRIATGDERKCPFCAELVKREATVCRFCSKELPPPEAQPGIPRFKSKKEYDAWKGRQIRP